MIRCEAMNKQSVQTERGVLWVAAQIPLLLLTLSLPALVPAGTAPWPFGTHSWRNGLSIALDCCGLLLLGLGLLRLGRNLTPFPRPKAAGALVTKGIYGLVRHPIYGGVVMLAFASAVGARTWLVMPIAFLVLLFFDRKASREEVWLAEQFQEYAAYCGHTAKLFPWVY